MPLSYRQNNIVIIEPQVQPIIGSVATSNNSEINGSNRVGHTETSTDDEDGEDDDYYDYYNDVVGKGGDYDEGKAEKDEVKKIQMNFFEDFEEEFQH